MQYVDAQELFIQMYLHEYRNANNVGSAHGNQWRDLLVNRWKDMTSEDKESWRDLARVCEDDVRAEQEALER